MRAPANNRTWQLWPCGSGYRVKDTRKGLWNLLLWLGKGKKARHVSGVSLHGGLERPLCNAMKVKPGLPWRPQNVGDDRAVGYFQGEILTMESAHEKEVYCSQQRRKELEVWRALLTSDMEIQSLEFAQLLFGLVFLHYAPFRIIMYILCHYVEDHGEEQQMALELMEYGLPVAQSWWVCLREARLQGPRVRRTSCPSVITALLIYELCKNSKGPSRPCVGSTIGPHNNVIDLFQALLLEQSKESSTTCSKT